MTSSCFHWQEFHLYGQSQCSELIEIQTHFTFLKRIKLNNDRVTYDIFSSLGRHSRVVERHIIVGSITINGVCMYGRYSPININLGQDSDIWLNYFILYRDFYETKFNPNRILTWRTHWVGLSPEPSYRFCLYEIIPPIADHQSKPKLRAQLIIQSLPP